jgi:hypothetical protein
MSNNLVNHEVFSDDIPLYKTFDVKNDDNINNNNATPNVVTMPESDQLKNIIKQQQQMISTQSTQLVTLIDVVNMYDKQINVLKEQTKTCDKNTKTNANNTNNTNNTNNIKTNILPLLSSTPSKIKSNTLYLTIILMILILAIWWIKYGKNRTKNIEKI